MRSSSSRRVTLAEDRARGLAGRGPLSDDGDRDRVEPTVLGQPGRHRPRGPDIHRRHAPGPAGRAGADWDLFFITGADALEQILSWRDPDELFALAHFVGCTRPEHSLTAAGLPPDKVTLVEVPALAISSTECRAGRPWRADLVPRSGWNSPVHHQTSALFCRPDVRRWTPEGPRTKGRTFARLPPRDVARRCGRRSRR